MWRQLFAVFLWTVQPRGKKVSLECNTCPVKMTLHSLTISVTCLRHFRDSVEMRSDISLTLGPSQAWVRGSGWSVCVRRWAPKAWDQLHRPMDGPASVVLKKMSVLNFYFVSDHTPTSLNPDIWFKQLLQHPISLPANIDSMHMFNAGNTLHHFQSHWNAVLLRLHDYLGYHFAIVCTIHDRRQGSRITQLFNAKNRWHLSLVSVWTTKHTREVIQEVT